MPKPSDPYGTGPACAIGEHVENLTDAALAADLLARSLGDDAADEAGLARLIATTVREAAEAIERERHRLAGEVARA